MCYMAISHDEVVVPHDGLSFAGCTAMDGDELTQHTVVADDGPGLFAAELQILRDATDHGVREDMAVIAKYHIVINIREGVYRYVFPDLGFRAHIS